MFQARPEYEALYGGAAGGGKSDSLLTEALRQVHIPHYRGIIFRKTFPELADLIDRSQEIYRPSHPRAKYNDSKHYWLFPSGAKIRFGNMQHAKDRTKYQGMHFDFIGFDELTHFTWQEYSYMMSRNRPNGPGTRVYIRGATNPGGVGHGWVKDRFITAAPPMTPIVGEYEVIRPDGTVIKIKRSRIFVPAVLFDNPILLSNDPMYLANMAMMPEAERDALLYGSWDSFEGQVFREWVNDSARYKSRLWTHVIEPFEIPRHWRIYRGFDWGYAKPFSVGWYAVDTYGRVYRIAEYYGCTGTPNEGIKQDPFELAGKIREYERTHPILSNWPSEEIKGIADPSIFNRSSGESIADLMYKHPHRLMWDTGDNTRIPGKMQYHYRLAFDERGVPMFQVFNTCRHFIRTIPTLVYDQKHMEDIDTEQEDHIYDECRYVLMANPIAPRPNMLQKPPASDPLNLWRDKDRTNDHYRY